MDARRAAGQKMATDVSARGNMTKRAWIIHARFVMFPLADTSVAIFWPAALLASITASLQTIVWFPLGVRYIRIVLAVLIPAALATFGLASASFNVNQSTILTVYLIFLSLA